MISFGRITSLAGARTGILALTAVAMLITAALVGATASAMGGPTGAIFTTVPDGSVVNENVHYNAKIEVYLDGGPPPNAPAHAAGLDEGLYVFQVTDPSGWVLLSEDPAKCRVVHVGTEGFIDALVAPSAIPGITDDTYIDANGDVVPCHVQDDPDGVAGPSGRHDTNIDVDHGDAGSIVVQLMPFVDTPNPGGVYKAWMTPIEAYEDKGETATVGKGKNARILPGLEVLPADRGEVMTKGKVKILLGFNPDPGFGPPRNIQKTDNFKVKEFAPAALSVRKVWDRNGNGIEDAGDLEIDTDVCVLASGALDLDCTAGGGGWPYDWTEPLADGTTLTTQAYTPGSHVGGVAGTYTAVEDVLAGWTQTGLIIDGVSQPVSASASVEVAGEFGESHEIVFLNAVPDVQIVKTSVSPINAGDLAEYTITVTNNGPVTATGVTVTESASGIDITSLATTSDDDIAVQALGLFPFVIGTLAVGESFSITIFTPTDADDCGTLTNVASVSVTNDPDESNNEDSADIVVLCPDVTVEKTAVNATISADEEAAFSIVVSNDGPGDAYGVTLSDTLPGTGWSLDSDSSGTCSITSDVLECGPIDMADGDSFTVEVSRLTSSDDCTSGSPDIYNVATVAATNEPVGAQGNNSDDAGIEVLCPDVVVDKTAVNAVIVVGDTASFDITVTNDGPGYAYGVTLSDTLPGSGWSIDSDSTGTCDLVGNQLDCGPVDLDVDESFSVTVSRATSVDDCGDVNGDPDIYNVATVAADNEPAANTSNNSDDAAIEVLCPDVAVEKTGSDTDFVGSEVSFTITVTNVSGDPATGVGFSDSLPGDGWVETADSDGVCSTDGSVLDCGPIDLAAGESFSVTVSRTTNLDDCGGLDNIVTVTADADINAANDTDSANIAVLCPDCGGLTPGYWKNWRNHYTDAEFESLLVGTIAGSIAEADAIFDHWDASNPDDMSILNAFTLANQLTVNLTVNTYFGDGSLFNDNDRALYDACILPGTDEELGDALTLALDYIARLTNGDATNDPSDEEILALKNILDAFANLNNAS